MHSLSKNWESWLAKLVILKDLNSGGKVSVALYANTNFSSEFSFSSFSASYYYYHVLQHYENHVKMTYCSLDIKPSAQK